MTRLRTILFDLDDTLYPESAFAKSGFHAASRLAARALGVDARQVFQGLWELFLNGTREHTFDRWLAQQGLSEPGLVTDMVSQYRGHAAQIRPYPDVVKALPRLRQQYALGLVSDGYLAVQKGKLAALKLDHLLDGIVFSDALGRDAWKPSTRPFLEVVKRLRCEPQECVYIADNPLKDFVGPRSLAMRTLRIRRPGGMHVRTEPPSRDHEPDMEIRSLAEAAAAAEHLFAAN